MKKLILVFVILIVQCTLKIEDSMCQSGWFTQITQTGSDLISASSVINGVVYALNYSGNLHKTTNYGINWSLNISTILTQSNEIKFINQSTGFYSGYGHVRKTTNSGLNWQECSVSQYGGPYYDFSFLNDNTGWVCYIANPGSIDWGYIAKTTNGGVNWTEFPIYNYFWPYSVFFIDANTGYIGGGYNNNTSGIIFKTTNGGNSFTQLGEYSQGIKKLFFINASTGWLVANNGTIKKTNNGGINWVAQTSGLSVQLNSCWFYDSQTGWICGNNGNILFTSNGGNNWIQQSSPVSYNLNDINFINSTNGWIAANSGTILSTTTGGIKLPDTASAKYIPLAVGNVYKYNFGSSTGQNYNHKIRIYKDTIIDSKKYYVFNGSLGGLPLNIVRYDSLTGNFYSRSNLYCSYSPFEELIDSLASRKGDSSIICSTINRHYCNDTSNVTLFGLSVKTKKFTRYNTEGYVSYTYSKNFGISNYYYQDIFMTVASDQLIGCYINGVLYGDTSNITYNVSGIVRYADNNQPITSGVVKAIKLNPGDVSLMIVDTAVIQSDGTYILQHVPQDSVYIGVYPSSGQQVDYVITYYPSTIDWQSANVLYPSGNLSNINISAFRMTTTTASNSVNGKVMRLTDVVTGNLKDAVLYAKNGNTYVRCAVSDVNGEYHLQSLPSGNLKIIINRLGFTGDSTNVNVTSSSNIDSINFHLYRYTVGIKQIGIEVPNEFKLFQNYPNPFNPVTKIKFDVPSNVKGKTLDVKLIIYDIIGRKIQTLVNESINAGSYEVTFDGSYLASGIYFYQLSINNEQLAIKKMILLK